MQKGYLIREKGIELRIKQLGRKYSQSIKDRHNLKTHRLEIPLNRRQFNTMWNELPNRYIRKRQSRLTLRNDIITIDRYLGTLEGLRTAKIEFQSELEAACFQSPDWMGPEITHNNRFKDYSLSKTPINPTQLPLQPDENKNHFVIGAIPYFYKDGIVHIVTVTSRKKERIIFPKGQPESNMRAQEVALLEADEEAGVVGKIVGNPILIAYENDTLTHWLLFPMEVNELKSNWPEEMERERVIFDLKEAISNPKCHMITPALRFLSDFLLSRTSGENPG